jgi:hypothetical protein
VTKLSSAGATLGTYSVGSGPQYVAVDQSGNVWVANYGSANVTKLSSAGATLGTYSVGSNPIGIAVDQSGNVWVANYGSANVTKLSSGSSGVLVPLAQNLLPGIVAQIANQTVNLGAGSTVNGNAICLADGTGCPSLNNTIQSGILLTSAISDSVTISFSSAYNAASCVFAPTNSTATTPTILPYLTSLSSTGSVTVTINHAATVGTGATYNIVCSLWHST